MQFLTSINTGPHRDRFGLHAAFTLVSGAVGTSIVTLACHEDITAPAAITTMILTSSFTAMAGSATSWASNALQYFKPVGDRDLEDRRETAWRTGALAGALLGVWLSAASVHAFTDAPTTYKQTAQTNTAHYAASLSQ